MRNDFEKLISEMTLEEKASLCSGLDSWNTKPVERLGIPSFMMTDGPHGVRHEGDVSGGFFLKKSYPSTCFPTASALACTWDRSLLNELGGAIGEEALSQGISIVLGPAANIKRSPLCGRNFEYYSEDPALSTQLAASWISGIQKKGVGASLKHFAANNQETGRMITDSVIDERALREIYLASFEGAVKHAKPWTVMCAYNKVNGDYCSENKRLLTDILKKEWGFEGFVMSDWGAVNDRVKGVAAGLDLEMPGSGGENDRRIVEAVKSGKLPESALDAAVGRILKIVYQAVRNRKPGYVCDMEAHHALARRIASEGMVLLKNSGVLPLRKCASLAVIGAFAKKPRIQGGGSSHINPRKLDAPFDEIVKRVGSKGSVSYSEGYRLDEKEEIMGSGFCTECGEPDEALIEKAAETAAGADVAVVFAGLPDAFESEGYDRKYMGMPKSHVRLIEAVSQAQKNVVVVLMNGSPVEMPWLDGAEAVLEAYLGGEAAGSAIADILFGLANPCGKLAETFPKKLSDNPSYLNFPGEPRRAEYREGVFVGYRYYEKKEMAPLFPFGHGLSYTKFEYTGIAADKSEMGDTDTVTVTVKVKNVGSRRGKETVQLYVRDVESSVPRPVKELKGFEKVLLEPGEEKAVNFTLSKRAFAYYDAQAGDWEVEAGGFELLAGGSSADTPLKALITVRSSGSGKRKYTMNSTIGEILGNPAGAAMITEIAGPGIVGSIPEPALQMPLRSIMNSIPGMDPETASRFLDKLNKSGR